MSTLLNSGGLVPPLSEAFMVKLREQTINKWIELGLLDGLDGPVRENMALLYESQPIQLLREQWLGDDFTCHKYLKKHKL